MTAATTGIDATAQLTSAEIEASAVAWTFFQIV
jgi:hypothetical protein